MEGFNMDYQVVYGFERVKCKVTDRLVVSDKYAIKVKIEYLSVGKQAILANVDNGSPIITSKVEDISMYDDYLHIRTTDKDYILKSHVLLKIW